MEEILLTATRRSVIGKQVRALRREGKLPGVIYGHRFDPLAITMDLRDASRSLAGLAPSALVTVAVDGETHLSLVREKQRDKITGILKHVDFLAVSMKEKLRTKVSILLEGVSPAVKDFNGVVVSNINDIEVEALPGDLPEHIMVDISGLAAIGDSLHVKDLKLGKGVEIFADPEEVVVVIAGTKEEVEPEAAEVTDEPEVIERGKKEEEDF